MNFQFETQADILHREVRTRVLAGMETGHFDTARTILREYAELNPEQATDIRMQVVAAYGTSI